MAGAEQPKTNKLEQVLDKSKDTGLQLPDKFEDVFKKVENRKLLLDKVNINSLDSDKKSQIKMACLHEIESWKGETPDPKKERGKVAVLYLYNALEGRGNLKTEDISSNFQTTNKLINDIKPQEIEIKNQDIAKNIPITPVNPELGSTQIKKEISDLTNPELIKMREINEANKWMNIPSGDKGREYAKVNDQMVARMKKPGLFVKGYNYMAFSKEKNEWNEPTPDQNIQIAGIDNIEMRKMGEIKTENKWEKVASGKDGREYAKVNGKMVARSQNEDKSYTYSEFDAKKNEWTTNTSEDPLQKNLANGKTESSPTVPLNQEPQNNQKINNEYTTQIPDQYKPIDAETPAV